MVSDRPLGNDVKMLAHELCGCGAVDECLRCVDFSTRIQDLCDMKCRDLENTLGELWLTIEEAPVTSYDAQVLLYKDGDVFRLPPDAVRGVYEHVRQKCRELRSSGWTYMSSLYDAWDKADSLSTVLFGIYKIADEAVSSEGRKDPVEALSAILAKSEVTNRIGNA